MPATEYSMLGIQGAPEARAHTFWAPIDPSSRTERAPPHLLQSQRDSLTQLTRGKSEEEPNLTSVEPELDQSRGNSVNELS